MRVLYLNKIEMISRKEMKISLRGAAVASGVGLTDRTMAEVPELKREFTLPGGIVLTSQDLSRLGIESIPILADAVGDSETAAVAFYSNIPLLMKTIKKMLEQRASASPITVVNEELPEDDPFHTEPSTLP